MRLEWSYNDAVMYATYDILVFWGLQTHVRGMASHNLLSYRIITPMVSILDVLFRQFVVNGHFMPGAQVSTYETGDT